MKLFFRISALAALPTFLCGVWLASTPIAGADGPLESVRTLVIEPLLQADPALLADSLSAAMGEDSDLDLDSLPTPIPSPLELPSAEAPAATGPSTDELPALELPALELPRVNLVDRVPANWLSDGADAFPLNPRRQRMRMPRRCRTRGGYRRYCSGERIIAEPEGPAALYAERMGLGLRATALQLRHHRPFDEWMEAVADSDPEEGLTFPVPEGRMGRGFGHTRHGSLSHRRHNGVDIGAPEGSAIVAARGGLVAYAGNELTGYGNVVMVLHQDGFSTFYAHCRSVAVFAGQRVERGQTIAEVGDTGFARAAHLHFEWRQRGWVRDPSRRFLRRTNRPARRHSSGSNGRPQVSLR